MIASMNLPYSRFRRFFDLSQYGLSRRRRPKSRLPEPRPELMPKLDAAKQAEIIRTLTDLNRQVLSEIAQPEASGIEPSEH